MFHDLTFRGNKILINKLSSSNKKIHFAIQRPLDLVESDSVTKGRTAEQKTKEFQDNAICEA